MRIAAIISEYNPFHKGHEYHIKATRQAGFTHIVAVMGGNFTQRGDISVMSKFAKAQAALLCGVDLVIEMPVVFATATAEKFARCGVRLAQALGVVDALSFGAECADIERLTVAARAAMSIDDSAELRGNLQQGMTFAKARENTIRQITQDDTAKLFLRPNNNLAIEYIKAIILQDAGLQPIAIPRLHAAHDSKSSVNGVASASFIREILARVGPEMIEGYMPMAAYEVLCREIEKGSAPASIQRIERAILARLRTMNLYELALLPDISEGLDRKIFKEARVAGSLEELYSRIKSKRYTHARVRRLILGAFLGITRQDISHEPGYIRVLGFNKNGLDILRAAQSRAVIPIVTSARQISKICSESAQQLWLRECVAGDLYALSLPVVGRCGSEQTSGIVKML